MTGERLPLLSFKDAEDSADVQQLSKTSINLVVEG